MNIKGQPQNINQKTIFTKLKKSTFKKYKKRPKVNLETTTMRPLFHIQKVNLRKLKQKLKGQL